MATAVPRGGFDPKPVVAFFVLAYGLSWAWVIPWAATGYTVFQGEGWPTHLPSLLGPVLAAFAFTAWTGRRGGIRDLGARAASGPALMVRIDLDPTTSTGSGDVASSAPREEETTS